MDLHDIPYLSIAQLGELIKSKEISSLEATEAYLERISKIDGVLNSYITVTYDEARQSAKQADKSIADGHYHGPLHGIPVAVKDQFFTKGVRTTAGSNLLWEFIPEEDAVVVTKLKDAGAVLLGKLNLSEFALGESFSHPGGTPRNPWDLDRNPGISSSGSAAATSAFLCASALAEDTGGSTRIPAAWCGLAGLRPTWGRVSRRGVIPVCWSMDTVGPVARTVEDCAIMFQAIAGHDPEDPYSWETPVPDYRQGLSGGISKLRIGILREKVALGGLEPETLEALNAAIDQLSLSGAIVKEVSIPSVECAGVASKCITDMDGGYLHHERLKTRAQEYDHNSRVRLITGILTPAQSYIKAQKLRAMVRNDILHALHGVDVLILPTSPGPAPKIPEKAGIISQEDAQSRISGVRNFTGAFNLAGLPALSLPCGFTSENLPLSIQVAGRPMEEELLLRLGHTYQQTTNWHLRRPPEPVS